MAPKTEANPPISMLEQASDALLNCASRLRLAHAHLRSGEWFEPIAESEETLQAAAEKVERFRLNLLRTSRTDRRPREHASP